MSLPQVQNHSPFRREKQSSAEATLQTYNANTQILGSELFFRIFDFLPPSALRRASCVCKQWQVLGSNDELRNRASLKILNGTPWEQKFEVIASYNVDKLEDARFFFLGEKHEQHRYQRPNGHLTSALAARQRIAQFVEGSTSMVPVRDPQEIANCKRYLLIDDIAMNNIQFFGWDMDEKVHAQTLEAVWDPEKDGPKESCQDKVKVLNASINEHNQILVSIIPEFPPYLLHFKAADDLMMKFGEFTVAFFNLPADEYQKFLSTFTKLKDLLIERDAEHIKKHMPVRTISAASTVQKVAQLQAERKFPLIAVFQLGLEHLQRKREEEEFSLEIFYNEIAKHRAIVLFPKVSAGRGEKAPLEKGENPGGE